MSETVHYIGKLTPVIQLPNENLEQLLERLLQENLVDTERYTSTLECFKEQLWEKYKIFRGVVYEIESTKLSDADIFEAALQPDSTIKFRLQYYNGGCGFDEALDDALEIQFKKQNPIS